MGRLPIELGTSLGGDGPLIEEQDFDIVLTDETMPELIGTDLARQIRLLRSDIPIVLMSGYSGPQLLEHARAIGIREVLRKPLQSRDLAECFGRVLRS